MSHVTLRELHERRLSSMSSDERKVFEAAYRRAALVAGVELEDVETPAVAELVVDPRDASGGTV